MQNWQREMVSVVCFSSVSFFKIIFIIIINNSWCVFGHVDLNGFVTRSNMLNNSFNGSLPLHISNSAPAVVGGSCKESRKPIRLESLKVDSTSEFSKMSRSTAQSFSRAIPGSSDSAWQLDPCKLGTYEALPPIVSKENQPSFWNLSA